MTIKQEAAFLFLLGWLLTACGTLTPVAPTGPTPPPANNASSNQVWLLDFGSDPVVAGRRQQARVVVTAFTSSGTFSEANDSPGVFFYNNAGDCRYRLTIGGSVFRTSAGDRWDFVGLRGTGCGMQSLGQGTGMANANFPNAMSVTGSVSVTTQSALPTATVSTSWVGGRQ